MKIALIVLALVIAIAFEQRSTSANVAPSIPNPLIDYRGFAAIVQSSERERESRRLTENQFIQKMSEPGTVVLDARGANRYAQRHIVGAVNLPFTEFSALALAKVIPFKDSPILIYCNNNFTGDQASMFSKAPSASLNLSTYTSLKSYGYTNIYELGPLLDVKTTKLPFDGTEMHSGSK